MFGIVDFTWKNTELAGIRAQKHISGNVNKLNHRTAVIKKSHEGKS